MFHFHMKLSYMNEFSNISFLNYPMQRCAGNIKFPVSPIPPHGIPENSRNRNEKFRYSIFPKFPYSSGLGMNFLKSGFFF